MTEELTLREERQVVEKIHERVAAGSPRASAGHRRPEGGVASAPDQLFAGGLITGAPAYKTLVRTIAQVFAEVSADQFRD
jgi:hypothetical protein